MWSKGQVLFISCILTGITISRQQSIGCPKNCTLEVKNEKLPHSAKITTLSDKECEDAVFPPASSDHLSNFSMESKISSNPYRNYSKINMKFSKIKWHYLKIRLKPRETRKIPFCQEIKLENSGEFSNEAQVYLHCQRFCEDNEVVDIEYLTTTRDETETRILAIKVPTWNRIKSDSTCKMWELFLYTDTSKLPKLTVYWQNAPAHLGIKSYILNMTNAETEEVLRTIHVPIGYPFTTSREEFNELFSGKFYFTLQPICENNTQGYISKSAKVRIDLPSHTYFVLIAGGAATILSLLVFVWTLRSLTTLGEPPNVLIVYKATHSAHEEAMLAFTKFLLDSCLVDAKIDEIDIPLSINKDPFAWYQKTFSKADAVMVVSSPSWVKSDSVGIYCNLDKVGLNLVAEHFKEGKQKCFCVLLPYCSEEDIPEEAINLKRFTLLTDLDDMLIYLHERHRLPKLFCLRILKKCLGQKSKPYFDGKILEYIFEKATNELKNPPSTDTDIQYEEIIGHIHVVVDQTISDETNQTSCTDDNDGSYSEPLDNILSNNDGQQQDLSESNQTLHHTDFPESEDINFLVLNNSSNLSTAK